MTTPEDIRRIFRDPRAVEAEILKEPKKELTPEILRGIGGFIGRERIGEYEDEPEDPIMAEIRANFKIASMSPEEAAETEDPVTTGIRAAFKAEPL